MATYLFTVSDSFTIPKRGIMLSPGIPPTLSTPPGAYRGARIVLRRPDGTQLLSMIQGVELLDRALDILIAEGPPPIPILLPESLSSSDVPRGTEVWLDTEP